MMEFSRLERHPRTLLVEIKNVENCEKDLNLWLERKRGGDNIIAAELVVAQKQGQCEALRVPLEAPCDIEHLTSKVDLASRTMRVTMKLKPLENDHPLNARSDSKVDTDSESMHTAESDIDSVISVSTQHMSPRGILTLDAAATGDVAPVPSTPRQDADAEDHPSSIQLEESSVGSSDDSETHGGVSLQEPIVDTKKEQEIKEAQDEEEDDEIAEAVTEPSSKKKKKKKRKKKKISSNATADADAADTVPGNAEEIVAQEAPAPQEEPVNETRAENSGDVTVTPLQPPTSAAKGTTPVAALQPPAAKSRSDLTKKAPRHPLSGPYISQGLAKERSKGKGEDAWLLKPECSWGLLAKISNENILSNLDNEGEEQQLKEESIIETGFGAWGIFDGHGGKQVATYASNSVLKETMAAAEEPCLPVLAGPPITKADIGNIPSILKEEIKNEEEDSAREEWYLQAELARRLPTALSNAFIQCNAEAQRRFNRGGTTATVAMVVGWELIVANVGDSLAFLDTGAEVLAISGNHRLEDSKSEVERILASGGEVASSTVDGKPAGPIRVWPGGLAMSRSIGDVDAGARVCGEPEVCQVTIPYEGARVIIGSDGLWDALHPKTAAHHVRNLNAEAAAHRLLHLAINKDHLKDDVTVVVVDFMPREEDKIPPVLNLPRQSGGGGKHKGSSTTSSGGGGEKPYTEKLAHVWHPLRDEGTHRIDYIAAGHERRQKMFNALQAAEEERIAADTLRAEREAEMAAQRAVEAGKSLQGASGLYAELAHLTLTPEQIAAAFRAETAKKKANDEKAAKRAKEAEEGWEEVVPSHQQQNQQHVGSSGGGGQHRGGKNGENKQHQKQQRPQKAKAPPASSPDSTEDAGNAAAGNAMKKQKSRNNYGKDRKKNIPSAASGGGGGGGAPGAGDTNVQPDAALAAPSAPKKVKAPHLPPPQLVPTSVLLSTGPLQLAPVAAAAPQGGDAAAAAKKKKPRAPRRNNKPANNNGNNAS